MNGIVWGWGFSLCKLHNDAPTLAGESEIQYGVENNLREACLSDGTAFIFSQIPAAVSKPLEDAELARLRD